MTLTAGSLFSGIGGLDLAAAMAGFDIRFHVELDDWRRKVLAKHAPIYWPNALAFKDITTLNAENLPPVDVLFGGFPCQDVSVAGNRAGVAEGTRSGLWFHFRRLIGDLRPRAVVVENVKGLLTLGGSRVIADLAEMGYVGRWGVISAADAGAPHQRDRIWIVAYAQQNRRQRSEVRDRERSRDGQRDNSLCEQQWSAEFRPSESGSEFQREAALGDTSKIRCEGDRARSGVTGLQRSRTSEFARRGGLVNTSSAGCEECDTARVAGDEGHTSGRFDEHRTGNDPYGNESRMGRNPDGIPARLDGFIGYPSYRTHPQFAHEPPRIVPRGTSPYRTARIEALGDAVVPWQAYPIFHFLHNYLQEYES